MPRRILGRDWSDLYVARCGEVLSTYAIGVDHEKTCRDCAARDMENQPEESPDGEED